MLFEDGDVLWQLFTYTLPDAIHRLIDLLIFRVAFSRDMLAVAISHCGLSLTA